MYGLVNKAIEELVVTSFGEDKWEAIKLKAGVDVEVFVSNEAYPDEMTYDLVSAASEVLGASASSILIAFGEHWVLQTASTSYGSMMRAGGASLKDFLINLPNFHTRVQMIYPKLQPPRFECSDVGESSLTLHYFTHRSGLTDFVVGLVQGLGKLYSTPAMVTLVAAKSEGADHDVFEVHWSAAAA
ncbi:MAG: heme NO-binding protein [Verrucomicrobia bacterium 12-59-8]|nr:MAG: heme NO-binding protein [Verrucomicrobia bacterium 12-59-8]